MQVRSTAPSDREFLCFQKTASAKRTTGIMSGYLYGQDDAKQGGGRRRRRWTKDDGIKEGGNQDQTRTGIGNGYFPLMATCQSE